MTAVTVTEAYDNTLTNEGQMRIAYLLGSQNFTYTPGNSSGKTIRILSAYSESGTAVGISVASGVMTVKVGLNATISTTESFTVLYTVT